MARTEMRLSEAHYMAESPVLEDFRRRDFRRMSLKKSSHETPASLKRPILVGPILRIAGIWKRFGTGFCRVP
jgi:hypothetical protein